MSYQAKIQSCPGHLRVDVSGHRTHGNTVADADSVGQQIVAECRSSGVEKVLLVLHLTGRMSALDAYEIVTGSQEYGWSRAFKLAFVDLNADSLDDSLFTETVAVNRAYPMKVFANEHDAEEWLLGA